MRTCTRCTETQTPKGIAVFKALHASHNGCLYIIDLAGTETIAEFVRNNDLESLSSSDGQFDFWFTPSTRPNHHRVNMAATEIFAAYTDFDTRNMPLLRGNIVITAHDKDTGAPSGLTATQLNVLAHAHSRGRRGRRLTRRCVRDLHRQRIAAQARHAAARDEWLYGRVDRSLGHE